MKKALAEKLLEIESEYNSESNSQKPNNVLSLKKEMKFSSPFQTDQSFEQEDNISKEKDHSIVTEVKRQHSGLFYKVDNHFNLMSLVTHFNQWMKNDLKVFAFHSFVHNEEAFDTLLSLAAYFENKENKRTLIVSERKSIREKFSHEGVENKTLSLSENSINIESIGSCLNFVCLYDLLEDSSTESIDKIEKRVTEIKQDYDLVLLLLPEESISKKTSAGLKPILMNCSNVSYILNKKKTKANKVKKIRAFYKQSGLSEGGAIFSG